MIIKATVVWSPDDLKLLGEPGISRATAAIMLGVHTITIGRWVTSGKIKTVSGGKICTASLKAHVEKTVAEAIAKAVKFGGQANG